MKRLFLVACALVCLSGAAQAQRTYWKGNVSRMASHTFSHTHVRLDSVVVVYTAAEADSDFHVRVRDPRDTVWSHFIIAECIPAIPCTRPRVGDLVTVYGIMRYDAEHGWAELHPVERGFIILSRPSNR